MVSSAPYFLKFVVILIFFLNYSLKGAFKKLVIFYKKILNCYFYKGHISNFQFICSYCFVTSVMSNSKLIKQKIPSTKRKYSCNIIIDWCNDYSNKHKIGFWNCIHSFLLRPWTLQSVAHLLI